MKYHRSNCIFVCGRPQADREFSKPWHHPDDVCPNHHVDGKAPFHPIDNTAKHILEFRTDEAISTLQRQKVNHP